MIESILVYFAIPFILFCACIPFLIAFSLGATDGGLIAGCVVFGNVTGFIGLAVYDKFIEFIKLKL